MIKYYMVVHAQTLLTLCNSMDCSSPGSSVHGILQARLLEWVTSGDLPDSRIKPAYVSCLAGRFFMEAQRHHKEYIKSEEKSKKYTH